MEITVLPEDLNLKGSTNLQLFNYRRTQDIQKTKINLSKNTISFLRAGTKEVIGDDTTVRIENQHFVIMKTGNCLMTEKVSNSNKVYQSILLFFSNEEVFHFLEKHDQFLSKIKQQKSFYIFQYDAFTNNFVDSLEQVLKLPKALQSKFLKTKFEEIMLYLVHQYSSEFLNSLVQNLDDKISRLTNILNTTKRLP